MIFDSKAFDEMDRLPEIKKKYTSRIMNQFIPPRV